MQQESSTTKKTTTSKSQNKLQSLMQENSHEPKINQKSSGLTRSISDLYKWQEIKASKQLMMKQYFDYEQGKKQKILCYTNQASNEILKSKRQSDTVIEDILIQKGIERQQKIKELADEIYGNQGKPQITKKAQNLKSEYNVYSRLYGMNKLNEQQFQSKSTRKNQSQMQSIYNTIIPQSTKNDNKKANYNILIGQKQNQSERNENKINDQFINKQRQFSNYGQQKIQQNSQSLSNRIKSFLQGSLSSRSPDQAYKQSINQIPVSMNNEINMSPIYSNFKVRDIYEQQIESQNSQIILQQPKECYLNIQELQKQVNSMVQDKQVKQKIISSVKNKQSTCKKFDKENLGQQQDIIRNNRDQYKCTKKDALTNSQKKLKQVYNYILEKE